MGDGLDGYLRVGWSIEHLTVLINQCNIYFLTLTIQNCEEMGPRQGHHLSCWYYLWIGGRQCYLIGPPKRPEIDASARIFLVQLTHQSQFHSPPSLIKPCKSGECNWASYFIRTDWSFFTISIFWFRIREGNLTLNNIFLCDVKKIDAFEVNILTKRSNAPSTTVFIN